MRFGWRGTLVPGVGGAFTPGDLSDAQDSVTRRAAFASVGQELGVPVTVTRQVHGADIHWAHADGPGFSDRTDVKADALVTTERRLAVAVRVADCVPILMTDTGATVVAAVHAGRQGLLAGVIDAAIDAMRTVSDGPLVGWIGPHICGSCYEIPDAMAVEVSAELGVTPTRTQWGTAGLDLGAAAAVQLAARDVVIMDGSVCTRSSPDLPSHRQNANPARAAALVWLS